MQMINGFFCMVRMSFFAIFDNFLDSSFPCSYYKKHGGHGFGGPFSSVPFGARAFGNFLQLRASLPPVQDSSVDRPILGTVLF